MTNNQINRAVAEACGWEEITDSEAPEEFQRRASGMLRDEHNNRTPLKQIPDYCKDLNAMQQAISILNNDQFVDFIFELMSLEHEPMLSTARQRAEAFLRTVGKWEEVQP